MSAISKVNLKSHKVKPNLVSRKDIVLIIHNNNEIITHVHLVCDKTIYTVHGWFEITQIQDVIRITTTTTE